MSDRPVWGLDGADWPNRQHSHFIEASDLIWHVQRMGTGPVLLMLHGTGAATHSWRELAPVLAHSYTVIAPDLMGHGFTELPPRSRLTLPAMARGLVDLLARMDAAPHAIIGHSAGAAIAMRMTLDGRVAPRHLISLNGALMPFSGLGAFAFPILARLMSANDFSAAFLSRRAMDAANVRRLIEGTGSIIDDAGLEFYRRLMATKRHVSAAIGMMANWDLQSLKNDMSRIAVPVTLLHGARDRAVPIEVARQVKQRIKTARLETVMGAGHLAHEEKPSRVAELVGGILSGSA